MTEKKHAGYIRIIQENAAKMDPPRIPELPKNLLNLLYPQNDISLGQIRLVAFDIYGTLFTSAAGDIASGTAYSYGNLDALALQFAEDATGEELKSYFRTRVMEEHGNLYTQTPYPEVRVEDIWAEFPKRYPDRDPAELALRYELAVNPVAPMPYGLECIQELHQGGFILGLVSNAQFYTPLLFEGLWGKGPEALGFDRKLCAFSYQYLRAKPSPELFEVLIAVLTERGIRPDECVYIGNDMFNDIYGAAEAGFKTILFAGDSRSLRLRENNKLCQTLLPDVVLRELRYLPALLGVGTGHE